MTPPTFVRPPRECYVDLGLEWRQGDSANALRTHLGLICAAVEAQQPKDSHDAMRVALDVEQHLKGAWPDRAYFIETYWPDASGGFVQIFQPWGVPRNA